MIGLFNFEDHSNHHYLSTTITPSTENVDKNVEEVEKWTEEMLKVEEMLGPNNKSFLVGLTSPDHSPVTPRANQPPASKRTYSPINTLKDHRNELETQVKPGLLKSIFGGLAHTVTKCAALFGRFVIALADL